MKSCSYHCGTRMHAILAEVHGYIGSTGNPYLTVRMTCGKRMPVGAHTVHFTLPDLTSLSPDGTTFRYCDGCGSLFGAGKPDFRVYCIQYQAYGVSVNYRLWWVVY
ncbi:MAG: hypothetical protein KatS3mg054_0539 [Chloroflexus sp.]|nr:MAG: hypothetical protein KatS3mg054_0539 [Chloroflexus sp.]GIV93232.1 MAG: hypothetical protein KatS3mg056_1941 [Chloroflexus sp.]